MDLTPFTPPGSSLGEPLADTGALLDTLPWGVLVLDAQGIIRRVNQQAARWLGLGPAALLGRPLAAAALPPAVAAALRQLLEPGATDREVFLPEPEQWVALTATRQPGGWVVYGHDITLQKQREQQYQALAENTPDVLTRWGPDLRLRYANAAFAAQAGQPLSALLGRTFGEMAVPAEVSGPYMAALQRVFATGQPQEHANDFPTPHGTLAYHSRLVPELRDGEIETVLGIARDLTELHQTQAEALGLRDALARRATDKYHALFYRMDQGFCVLEVLFDEASGQAVDFRYLELNPVFARQSGMPEGVQGRTVREVLPDLDAFWFDTYGQVARTGQPVRVEHEVPQVGRWFDVHAFPLGEPGSRQVAVLFTDITARKLTEQRQQFLLQLSDALRPLSNPLEMQLAAVRVLGEHLGVDRTLYVEVEPDDEHFVSAHTHVRGGFPEMTGRYSLRDFGQTPDSQRAGETLVLPDISAAGEADEHLAAYRAAGVRASIGVPLRKDGRWVASLTVHHGRPRHWTPEEVALVEETAERTWAAVARARAEEALRESEEQFRTVTNLVPDLLWRSTLASDTTWYNEQWYAYTGQTPEAAAGYGWTDAIHPDDQAESARRYRAALTSGQLLRQENRIRSAQGEYRWFQVQARSLRNEHGLVTAWYGAATDIHARKLAELRLRHDAEADAFRVQFQDVLRPLADAAAIQGEAARLLRDWLEAGWCYYNEFDETGTVATVTRDAVRAGLPSFAGVHDLSSVPDYLAYLRAGHVLNAPSITATGLFAQPVVDRYVALGMRAALAVPLVKEGRLLATLVVADTVAREWSEQAVAMLQEVAERTWAAVARARAETAQRTSEQRLRLITDATPALIAYVDAGLRYRFVNQRYHDWFGQVPEELWGQPLREVVGEAAFAQLLPHAEAALAGQRQAFEAEMVFQQAGLRYVQTELVPDVQPDGSVAGYYSLVVDLTARKQAEDALRASELKYRTLFDSIDEGFALEELVYDANGEIEDIIFREVNRAYERQGGLTNVVGKSIREVLPDMEQHRKAVYAQLARTGQPVRLINYAQDADRWFDTYITLLAGSNKYVAVVFSDITARKQQEQQQEFLLKLGEIIRTQRSTTGEMQAAALHLLAAHFGVMRSVYYEGQPDEDTFTLTASFAQNAVPIPAQLRLSDFSPTVAAEYRTGRTQLVADTENAPLREAYRAIGVRAWLAVPFVQEGRLVTVVGLHAGTPRAWTPADVQLLEYFAERLYAAVEKGRAEEAMRASEARYAALFAASPVPFMVLAPNTPDFTITAANEAYFAATYSTPADLIGRRMLDVFTVDHTHPGRVGSGAVASSVARVLATKQTDVMPRIRYDLMLPGGELEPRWWLAINAPLFDAAGQVSAIIHQATNVTELYYAEVAEQQRRQQQAFLLQLSDALRPLASPADIQARAAALLGKHLGVERAYYVDLDYDTQEFVVAREWHRPGTPSPARRYPLGDWPMPWLLGGQPWVCHDVDTDPTLPDEQRADYRGNDIQAAVVVPLLKQGRLAATLVVNQNAPRSWTPQQVALVEETAERTWAAVERAKVEEALRASEDKYRRIFENIDQGFSLHELLIDESGNVTDVILREVNEAFEQQTGLKNAQGKKVSEIVPSLEQGWLDAMTRAYKWGETQRFEAYNPHTNRWLTSQYSRLGGAGSRLLSTVFTDITERKQRERHQEFLLKLSDALRPVADSAAMERAAMQVLGATLAADRVFLATTQADGTSWSVREEYAVGLPGGTGSYPMSAFQLKRLPQWQAGQLSSVADSETDPTFSAADRAAYAAFGLRAAIGVPLVKGARFTALLCVNQATPRRWTAAELALTSEAAERIWVALERARAEEALAASEQRLRALITNLPSAAAFVVGPDLRYQLAGGEALDAAGLAPADLLGRTVAETMPPELVPQYEAHYRQALTGQGFSREHTAHGHTFISHGVPLLDAAGQPEAVLVVSYDISARKQAEEALRTSQTQLAELNTALEQRVAERTQELRENRDLLQSVLDSGLVAVAVFQTVRTATGAVDDFSFVLVNKEQERLSDRRDLVGQHYAQVYPGIRKTGIWEQLLHVVATGQPQQAELYYPYDELNRWYEYRFVALGDGVVATTLDITARKQAEAGRLRNLHLLEQAEAVAGLGSWDYHLLTGSFLWSDGMYQLFGLPLGQPVHLEVYEQFVVAEDRPRAEQLVAGIVAGTHDFEEILRLRVGEQVKTVRVKVVVLRDEAGQPVRALGVDVDISELQRLEADNLRLRLGQQQALFEAVQAAQETERKRMAESLHNGIGQILYATKLRLDYLATSPPGTDPALATARREANQLLGDAIRQTRALSHELVPLVLEEFGLAVALQDIGRKMSTPQLRLRCHVELDEAAPLLAPPLQMALYRMAQELAQNIVKHALGATEASLELETMPGWVLLRAEDDGPGFGPAPTSGLGLRTIRDRVALLGGQLKSGSGQAGGAYVRIRIPLPLSTTP